jgi:hypothetical protein
MISPYHGSEELIRKRDSSGIKYSIQTLSFQKREGHKSTQQKLRDFLDLDFSNSKSNSYRIKIHLEYFPPSTWRVKICCMGLHSEITVVLWSRM